MSERCILFTKIAVPSNKRCIYKEQYYQQATPLYQEYGVKCFLLLLVTLLMAINNVVKAPCKRTHHRWTTLLAVCKPCCILLHVVTCRWELLLEV